MTNQLLAVSIGAVLGANARYLLALWLEQRLAPLLPLGTLLVNLVGTLALTILVTAGSAQVRLSPEARLFLTVGFLGSFTTFSTFGVETWAFVASNRWHLAGLNLVLGLGAGVCGVWLGSLIGRRF